MLIRSVTSLEVRMPAQGHWLLEDHRALLSLSSERFPVAEDFAIEVFPDPSVQGYGLRFVDSGLDSVVGFPWWTNVERDLRSWSISDVPTGTVENPYTDAEQSWEILLWRAGEWIFIMEGDGEAEFSVWFRVRVDRYCSEWERVIKEVKGN